MKRQTTRHIAVLSILLSASTCLAGRGSDDDWEEAGKEPDDRKTPKNHELKIFSNDPRMNLDQNAEPVTLSVYFMLTSPFEILELRLPPGFRVVPDPKLGCGVYSLGDVVADSSTAKGAEKAFARRQKATHLTPYIEHCHVYENEEKKFGKHGDELTQVHVKMSIKPNVPDLSLAPRLPEDPEKKSKGVWWCFALHVRNPMINPSDEDNVFALFHFHRTDVWNGDIYLRGWPIYGDWDCTYSEWQGWGSCSARCGGGTTRLTRRLLNSPPPHRGKDFAKPCEEPLEKIIPCNEYPCKFPCELVDVQEAGVCSAECGGGVKAKRWRWRGEGCPAQDDYDSIHYEVCNPEPCRVRCKLADTWTVVTGCSEMCGQGTYRMMREVIQKDTDDAACQPEWREVKCVRQWCTQLTILRPDRNILPYPGDTYYVGIAFKPTFPTQSVTLSAPAGYSFGAPGSDCFLHDHDLFPFYKGCKVGTRTVDGYWLDARSVTLLLDGVLPKSDIGRYHFMIAVTNPGCPRNNFIQTVTIGEEPGPKEVCNIPYDQNLWEMKLTKETVVEGHQPILSLWASGYELHNPEDSKKVSSPGSKDMFWRTTNDAQYVSLQENSWRARVVYCSARLEPCPSGAPCPPSGVCPTVASEDAGLMEDASWTLDDSVKVDDQVQQVDTSNSDLDEMEDPNE